MALAPSPSNGLLGLLFDIREMIWREMVTSPGEIVLGDSFEDDDPLTRALQPKDHALAARLNRDRRPKPRRVSRSLPSGLAVVRLCRQIRNETLPILYSENKFALTTTHRGITESFIDPAELRMSCRSLSLVRHLRIQLEHLRFLGPGYRGLRADGSRGPFIHHTLLNDCSGLVVLALRPSTNLETEFCLDIVDVACTLAASFYHHFRPTRSGAPWLTV